MPASDPAPYPFQTTVIFPLTVASDLSLTAQSLLRRECGAGIHAISLEPRPDTHDMRLWVTLESRAYNPAVHAVIMGLPAAEFGAVRPSRTDIVTLKMAA